MKRFTDKELRQLRNDTPVRSVIETLLQLPHKEVEGVYRFLCPLCEEFETGLNPHTERSSGHPAIVRPGMLAKLLKSFTVYFYLVIWK